jgi:hypothetical protein
MKTASIIVDTETEAFALLVPVVERNESDLQTQVFHRFNQYCDAAKVVGFNMSLVDFATFLLVRAQSEVEA